MRSIRFILAACVGLGLTYACSSSDNTASGGAALVDPACADDTTQPPNLLSCTGLYSNYQTKAVSADVKAYAPAVILWSDGAEKSRWVQLPKDGTIDATDPMEWKFPVGTKAWKEFKVGGKRVETRLWEKVDETSWVNATYQWSDDESKATLAPGGDITLSTGATYHIPTNDECQQCHRGRKDRLLGFEEGLLGLPDATGYTLSQLVADNKIVPAPSATSHTIGDDGTGTAAAALGWIHVNCGVTCHNTNESSLAFAAGMNFRLDPTMLDGRPSNDFGARATTIGLPAVTPQWQGETRIVAGDPDNSLLVQLISRREDANQMPPIATRVVDDAHVAVIRDWVTKMGGPPIDTSDAGTDGGTDQDSGTQPVDSGAPVDSGTPIVDAGTSTTDAGVECETGSIEESDPDDTSAQAISIAAHTESYCGRVTPGDTDYFTFTLPATVSNFSIGQTSKTDGNGGTFVISGTVNGGQAFTLSGGNPPVVPGGTYLLKVTAAGATANVDYIVHLQITP